MAALDGKRYEDWVLEDPVGKGVESVRPIRNEIKARVLALLAELDVAPVRTSPSGPVWDWAGGAGRVEDRKR